MKFKFWKNKKDDITPEENSAPRYQMDKSDISTVYDYDKIAHNQFLTDDKKYGEYMDEKSIDSKRIDANGNIKTNYKQENMMCDEIAFDTINRTINLNLGQNQQEFKILYNRSENIVDSHKIPVKKRLFGKKDNSTYGKSISADNPVDVYNIQEDQTKKYDARVNYNALKNEQTKLLDLTDLNDKGDEEVVETAPQTHFSVSSSNGQLTNRLFENATIDPAPTPAPAFIPRKTINLANEAPLDETIVNLSTPAPDPIVAEAPAPTPTPTGLIIKTKELANEQNTLFNNSTRPYNNSINLADALHHGGTKSFRDENNDIFPTPSQVKKPIATTALRYLTPVEEEDFEENRIKKENRRFIKPRG